MQPQPNNYRLAYLRWLRVDGDPTAIPPLYQDFGLSFEEAREIRNQIDNRIVDPPLSPTARRPMNVSDCCVPQKRLFDMFDSTAMFPTDGDSHG